MTFARVLDLHSLGIRLAGGTHGVPKPGCVESSLGAAENAAFYTAEGDPLHVATYLLYYLARNHCFPDGNKRVAWLCFVDLLFCLHITVDAPDDEIVTFVEDVARGVYTPEAMLVWIAARLSPVLG